MKELLLNAFSDIRLYLFRWTMTVWGMKGYYVNDVDGYVVAAYTCGPRPVNSTPIAEVLKGLS